MKTKIETLGNWSAHACLHSALEEVEPDDAVIVVTMRGDNPPRWWTANVKTSTALLMVECVKQKVMDDMKEVRR
jgi:hypothetical protein